MWKKVLLCAVAVYVLAAAGWVVSAGVVRSRAEVELLNAACDPTRELWRDLNARFITRYEQERGAKVVIRQSHGGSGSQARAVIDGLGADVATLALFSDTDAIRKAGLIDEGWESRLPNRSLPFVSTIVFVVRKGNPKNVHDWPDLVRPGVEVITPNPKTSGNGKWSFLAAWGAIRHKGGSEDEARDYVTQLYRQVPILDAAARGATMTFATKRQGDVHLTWENEAFLEVQEAAGELEIVYPPASVLAEPHVAVVSANVRRKGTKVVAEAYMNFLYTEEAQEIMAHHYYRPTDPAVWKKVESQFPKIDLFPFATVGPTWDVIQKRFFAEGGVFDQIYARKP
ncbi:sulfate ABC transporter substrate-binding protein [Fimbriiglobus ruber]|uniref:Sulfate and thiosulfate binding protein CysP n=1 Tax=Fimbriiglobus ruber TaxID=1908690 RepID=A0A225DG95_9BACT|nr:sulfate ABC transporter substrate-binding protein [Fimbriiglobus ruber]OWK40560.1 Sulfate and thiosulfate binding protein CysP [Fimbriiglobus ruber]